MRKIVFCSSLLLAAGGGAVQTQGQEAPVPGIIPAQPAIPPETPEREAELPPVSAEEEAETVTIENLSPESEVSNDYEEGLWYFRNPVIVRYKDSEIIANQAVVSERTGDIIADGNVRLRSGGQYWTGEHLEYNINTKRIRSTEFRAGYPPLYVKAFTLDATVDDQTYDAGQAEITSDDVKEPLFRFKAKKLRIRLGKSIHATGVTLYLGKTPVMWLPFYNRSLEQHRAYLRVTPGYRSQFGAYMRNEYHFPLYGSLGGVATVDLFSKRGIGHGPGLEWDSPKFGKGNASYWEIKDSSPGTDFTRTPLEENRHRISFSHMLHLQTNFTVRGVVKEHSDPLVIRDFFESEYRQNSQPRTFVEAHKFWDNWSLDIMAQAQVNEFYETVERLPDVKFSGIRQQIGASPLFYESESSAGYFRYRSGLENGTDYAAIRADTLHQVVLPKTFFGWLNFTPRVGGRFTHYGETEGEHSTFDERERFVFNTGAETSFKASQVWRGAKNDFFDVRELRHIIEPSLNYVFVPDPTKDPNQLPQFDREIPSLRLLPIDFPDYNAIDSIDSQNVLRLGLRNKLQTKRGDEIQNLVNWAIVGDWRLDPREGQSTFSDIYSDLDLRPRSWLYLSSETHFRIQDREWQGAYHTATFVPNDTWSWRVGHRYFRGGPEFGPESDNNTIFHSFYYKFNENWAGRVVHHFEARDGTMEEQYYTLYRDFRSWTGAFTFRVREDRLRRETDYAFAFTFHFKVFPRYGVGGDANYPDLLLGG